MPSILPLSAQARAALAPPANALLAATTVCLASAMLALGAYFPGAACGLAIASAALLAFAITHDVGDVGRSTPDVVWPFVFFGTFSLVQTLPIPIALLHVLSPGAADVWAHSADISLAHAAWVPVSLAPEVSRIEAAKWLSYGAFAWIGVACGRSHRAERVAWVVLALACVAAFATAAHGLVGATRVFGLYEPRYAGAGRWRIGPLLNANHLSAYLSLGAISGLALLLASRRHPPLRALAIVLATCTLFAGVVLLTSRAAIALLVVGAFGALALARRADGRRRRLPSVARVGAFWSVGLLAAGAGLVALGYHEPMLAELRAKDMSKLRVARDSLALIRDFWAFGVGRGAFEGVYFAYKSVAENVTWTNPENIVVQWLAEWGIPASLVGTALLARAIRKARAFRERTVGRLLALALTLLVLHNLVDFSLEVPAIASLAVFVLGVLCGLPIKHGHPVTRDHTMDDATLAAPPLAMRPQRALLAAPALLALVALGALSTSPALLSDLRRDAFALWRAPQTEASLAQCRRWMARFPAEPYFPLTAGVLATRITSLGGIPWYNLALERAPRLGATHLLVSDALAAAGARGQARLELRQALEGDPSLADAAATRAIRISGEPEELLSIARDGSPAEVPFLSRLAERLPPNDPAIAYARERVLAREPCSVSVRVARAHTLLESFVAREGDCAAGRGAECAAAIETETARLAACPDGAAPAALLRAEVEWRTGDRILALAKLEEGCSEQTAGLLTCLQTLAERAADAHDSERLTRVIRLVVTRQCGAADECARAWAWASAVHARAGDAAASFADATKAVEANPGDLGIRVDYATAASRAGAYERAATALAYVSERKPGDADVAAKLSEVRTKLQASHAVTGPTTQPATAPREAAHDGITLYPPSGAAPLGSARSHIR